MEHLHFVLQEGETPGSQGRMLNQTPYVFSHQKMPSRRANQAAGFPTTPCTGYSALTRVLLLLNIWTQELLQQGSPVDNTILGKSFTLLPTCKWKHSFTEQRNGRAGIHGFLSGPVSSAVIAEYRNIRTSRKSLGLNAEDILIKNKVSCFWVLEFFKMQSQMMIWVKDTLFQHMTNHPIDVLFKQAFQGGKFYMGRYK